MVCAMPNTIPAIVDEETFTLAKELAAAKAHCDYAIFLGATVDNYNRIPELASQVQTIQIYQLTDEKTTKVVKIYPSYT